MTRRKIRIRGAVRIMRRAREQLAAGLAPDEVDAFRAEVRATVERIEEICRRHRVRVADLPSPTRRAYDYLAALEDAELPVRAAESGPRPRAPKRVEVTNVVATVDRMHAAIQDLADRTTGNPPQTPRAALRELTDTIRGHRDAIADLCRQQGGGPGDLPVPSRRGWQWLAWLSDSGRLADHVRAVATLKQRLTTRLAERRRDEALSSVTVRLGNHSRLLRARPNGNALEVDVHAAFAVAPSDVLSAVAGAVLEPDDERTAKQLRDWGRSSAFQSVLAALEKLSRSDPLDRSQGAHRDLAAIFERVNRTCFDGDVTLPHLEWSQSIALRVLGLYEPATDTVRISAALDDPRVPEVVVDFVMYHELLHKQLGVECTGGIRRAHTRAFRREERRFPRYAEAQSALRRLGR